MAYSVVPKTLRDGTITLSDGTGVPVTLVVAYEDGSLSYEQPNAQSSLVIMDRGTLSAVRKQEDQFITFTFTANMRQFTDAAAGSINDFVHQSSIYSTNKSTGAAPLTPYIEQYAIDVAFLVEGTDHGDAVDSTATFSKCIPDNVSFSEGEPNSFSLSFTCYGGVTFS